jgi:hypothetical protein
VFEVPLAISDQMGGDAGEEGEESDARLGGLRRLVDSALATIDGDAPADWTALSEQELAGWIAPEMLTVQCAQVACQGRVIRTQTRLALEFPIVTSIPAGLAPPRRQKLGALLREAHHAWRLVRVGLRDQDDRGAQSAIAEVDLTGLPAAAMEPLLRYSLSALHNIVRWTAAPAALLIDQGACELLDH